jgi:SAM-dependent methyltransferase
VIDWGLGQYELTARELEPVAGHVVSLAAPKAGDRVLDLATGTGNAALLAARRGAAVTGLDASARLIAVARGRAREAALEASIVVGDLQALPFRDRSFDAVLSVFGLIFAADPDVAVGELARVLAPAGRAYVSTWVPAGPIDAFVGVFARALAEVTGPGPPPFPWHDSGAVTDLAARHGLEVRVHEGALRIVADSPEAYLTANREHPMSIAGLPVLERAGTAQAVRERALAVLREGNEDPARFQATSPYRVIEVHAAD